MRRAPYYLGPVADTVLLWKAGSNFDLILRHQQGIKFRNDTVR